MLLGSSGCLSRKEITYQEKVGKMIDRYDDLSKNINSLLTDFSRQGQSLVDSVSNMDPTEFYSRWDQLIDALVPKFQQYLAELQQLKSELAGMIPPEKYSAAHSIFNSGLSTTVGSLGVLCEAFNQSRSNNLIQGGHFKIEELKASVKNGRSFMQQGLKNMETGRDMIFEPNWGLIVGVIIVVLALVAGIISFFFILGRRRSGLPCPAGGPAAEVGYPSPGYLPPQMNYGPPSEAFNITSPGGIQEAPPHYPPQQPPGPIPPPSAPKKTPQPVRCQRCGADVTAAGPFCPSCNAMLPGI